MKYLLVILSLACLAICGYAHQEKKIRLSAVSLEKTVVDGQLSLDVRVITSLTGYHVVRTDVQLPTGWLGDTRWKEGKLTARLQHPVTELPYYPQRMTLAVTIEKQAQRYTASEVVYIYFTPYGTVEVWSQHDFGQLPRHWHTGSTKPKARKTFPKESVPVSNLPAANDVEAWSRISEDDIHSVFVEGLAYSIPMVISAKERQAADEQQKQQEAMRWRKEYYGPKGGPSVASAMPPADDCGAGYRRYKGEIRGRITGGFINSETDNWFSSGLGGLDVEVWDDETLLDTKLGEGVTADDGTFAIQVDDCQFQEGDEVELYIKIRARNAEYNVKGYGTLLSTLVEVAESDVEDWPYNNGNSLDFDFGDIEVTDQAHKAVSLAYKAYTFTDAEASTPAATGLHIRTEINYIDNHNLAGMFIPNQYCGASNQLAGLALGVLNPAVGLAVAASNPTMYLGSGDANVDETVYHEFGHLVMWSLQDKCWISYRDGGLSDYDFDVENNPTIAWTEGFAEGFAAICDVYFHDDDGESRIYEDDNYELRTLELVANGFGCIEYIAATLLDLYDGPANYAHITNAPPYNVENNYYAGEVDDAELPFSLLTQIIENGHAGGSNDLITNIHEFYIELRGQLTDCDDDQAVVSVFDNNRILFDVDDRATGFAADGIYSSREYDYEGDVRVALLGVGVNIPWDNTMQYRRDVDQLNADNGNYNFGRSPYQFESTISGDLTIATGYKLHINDNDATQFYDGIQVLPFSDMEVSTCGPTDITIFGQLIVGDEAGNETASLSIIDQGEVDVQSGGEMIISNNSRVIVESGGLIDANYNSTVRIATGGELYVETNGQFRVGQQSTIIVENGGLLYIELGGELQFDGADAHLQVEPGGRVIVDFNGQFVIDDYRNVVLDLVGTTSYVHFLGGNLVLNNGAVLRRTGDGYILMENPEITMGQNAEIIINGDNTNDVAIRIADNTGVRFNHQPTARFICSNARIDMGFRSDLDFSSVQPTLTNALFIGQHGYEYGSVVVNGQPHTIDHCVFRYGTTGLSAFQNLYGSAVLTMTNSEILDCTDRGLYVNGAGVNLDHVFIHNIADVGYYQDMATQPSVLTDCEFTNSIKGIWYNGNANSGLHLDNPLIWATNTGVEVTGATTLTGHCGSISQNTFGIYVGFNSVANLSGQSEMNVTDNKYSIYLDRAYDLQLGGGSNDFMPINLYNDNTIVGEMRQSIACYQYLGLSPFDATGNHWNNFWNTPTGSLLHSYEYDVVDKNGAQIHIDGNDPMAFTACGQQPPNQGCDPYCEISVILNCTNCEKVNTPSFAQQRLDVAMRDAVETADRYAVSGMGDNLLAIEKLNELLLYPYQNINANERKILDFGYRKMMETFGEACHKGDISMQESDNIPVCNVHAQKVLDVVLSWKQLSPGMGASGLNGPVVVGGPCNPGPAEIIIGDGGHVFKAVGRNLDAIDRFDELIQHSTEPSAIEMAEYWRCIAEKDHLVKTGAITEEQYKSTMHVCKDLLTPAAPSIHTANRSQPEVKGAISQVMISPNPTTGRCHIQFELEQNARYSVELLDALGHVAPVTLNKAAGTQGINTLTIDLTTVEAGIYFVKIGTESDQHLEKLMLAR